VFKTVGQRRILILVFALSGFCLPAMAHDPDCPQLAGAPRKRVEQHARWLVSESLPQQVRPLSPAFAQLIRFEQCHVLESHLLEDRDQVMEGPFFAVDRVDLASLVGRQDRTWMMAIAPTNPKARMPAANLLELTDRQWTLMYRDKNGHKTLVASGSY